jgi:hypothetical protein
VFGGSGSDAMNAAAGMRALYTFLPEAENSDRIRKCWGEVPRFDGYCDIIHLSHDVSGFQIVLTCLFITKESDDWNKCKPSQMRIRFSEVLHWECDHDKAEANGISLAPVLKEPPDGYIAVDVQNTFYILCRKITILDCKHCPFTPSDENTVEVG